MSGLYFLTRSTKSYCRIMRERGALAVACEEGATATVSVAACICPGLRRQYAIGSSPSCAGPGVARFKYNCGTRPRVAAPFLKPREARDFAYRSDSLTPNRRSHDQIEESSGKIRPAPAMNGWNHENANKSKGPDKCPGLC